MKLLRLSLGLFVFMLVFADYRMPSTIAQTAEPSKTLQPCNPQYTIFNVVVSKSGKYLAANWKGGVRVWNIETGSPVSTFTADTMEYDDQIAISPDDRYVLTGGKSGTAILWDLFKSAPIYTLQLTPQVHSVAFAPDNKTILTGDRERSILWDIRTGNKIRTFSVGSTEHTQISSNGKYLLLRITRPQRVVILDTETSEVLQSFDGGYYDQTIFSPDGRYFVTGHQDGYRIWDAESYRQIQLVDTSTAVIPIGFSPDGKYWYGREKEAAILIYDIQTGEKLYRFDIKAFRPIVRFFPDSKRILVGKAWLDEQDWEAGGIYSVYDLTTGAELYTISIKDSPSGITDSVITPDGRYFITASATTYGLRLNLWDIRTGNILKQYC